MMLIRFLAAVLGATAAAATPHEGMNETSGERSDSEYTRVC